tara:strand:+ start:602 stop:745 length:144 start_codon:yes stop_codon:yes gene_type:complete
MSRKKQMKVAIKNKCTSKEVCNVSSRVKYLTEKLLVTSLRKFIPSKE